MTTDAQIEEMKAMAKTLEYYPQVAKAWVDDWGRFGNFTLMVRPAMDDRYATTRLKALIKRVIPAGAHLREVFPPGPHQKYELDRRTRTWAFDIDFQKYYLTSIVSRSNCDENN